MRSRGWTFVSLPVGFLILAAGLLPPSPAAAQLATTFDTDLEGWLITGDNAFTWAATGGNPDGNLDVNDLATGIHNFAVAPKSWLGDWSAFTPADSISYQFNILSASGSWSIGPMFRIAGPGGAASIPALTPTVGVWTTVTAFFDPADWVIESGTWEAILADVQSLRLNAEFIYGGEEVRVDNIFLSGNPVPIFHPCVTDDFNDGSTGDWTFQHTGGISNPGSGGNGGGYVSVTDGTGTGYAFAPARFLGDWTPLQGTGIVTVDLRPVSASGNRIAADPFIRLSGPGGVAHVSLPVDRVMPVGRVWTTLAFPLDETTWTVDSGSWSGLLAEITECRLQIEFFDGGETIGIDNFARQGPGCPPVDDTVTTYTVAENPCGYRSFLGIASVAVNPVDEELYGLVRAAAASGGGLYRLGGADTSTRLAAREIPAHLIFDTDGDAFISEDYSGNIYQYSQAGVSSLWVTGFHAGDDDPFGMTIAPFGFFNPGVVNPGDILVTDRGSSGPDEIWAFSPDSTEGERLVMPDPGNLDIFDLAADHADSVVYGCDLLVSDQIFRLEPTGARTFIPLDTPIPSMVAMASDWASGALYVATNSPPSLYRVEPTTGDVRLVADGFQRLDFCSVEVDVHGRRLWVADNGYGRVYEYCLVPTVAAPPGETPRILLGANPNPFRSGTTLRFELAAPGRAIVTVFDVEGARVRRLLDDALPAGEVRVPWDLRDDAGRAVAAGIYLARVEGDGRTGSVRLVHVR